MNMEQKHNNFAQPSGNSSESDRVCDYLI